MTSDIAAEFPQPTGLLVHAFAQLQIAASNDQKAKRALGAVSALPRPWDPSSCPPLLRAELWRWLDRVVCWLNHDYSWQAERVIPACWPAHPHLVHEVAVVACLRHAAGLEVTPDGLEQWHRYVLPAFLDRMITRLGGAPCQPGSHKPWPAAGRITDYESTAAVAKRRAAFAQDTTITTANAPHVTPIAGGNGARPRRDRSTP